MSERFDAVVVGGGFYGCAIALFLARTMNRVVLVEGEDELLARASYVNQARVHTGYHYPRSLQTAASSAKNLLLFREMYEECVDSSFRALYAIARGSKVSRQYFERFCKQLGLPLKPAPSAVSRLFTPGLIEGVFECREFAFNAQILRAVLKERLSRAGVEVRTGTRATEVRLRGAGESAVTLKTADVFGEVSTKWVFNTTYANLNRIAGLDPRGRVGLRHQVTELCLVRPPAALAELGVTVMDGPFFSCMPFPARGLHSLTHVRYTPHFTWQESEKPELDPDRVLSQYSKASRFEWMRRDASRYLRAISGAEYQDHLFEIKTTLVDTAIDDARPIAFHRDVANPSLFSVLGGKIDNIFDVLKVLERTLEVSGK
jgi:glycine/D-amino acid oxidase-like deaminating enzyme